MGHLGILLEKPATGHYGPSAKPCVWIWPRWQAYSHRRHHSLPTRRGFLPICRVSLPRCQQNATAWQPFPPTRQNCTRWNFMPGTLCTVRPGSRIHGQGPRLVLPPCTTAIKTLRNAVAETGLIIGVRTGVQEKDWRLPILFL